MRIKNWSFENVMIVAISGTVILLLFGWVGWLEDRTPVEEVYDFTLEGGNLISEEELVWEPFEPQKIMWNESSPVVFLQLPDGTEVNLTNLLAQMAEVRDMYQTLLWMVAPAVEEISSYPEVRAIGSERILILPE